MISGKTLHRIYLIASAVGAGLLIFYIFWNLATGAPR